MTEIERNPLRARIYGNYYQPTPYINNNQSAVQNLLGIFSARNAAPQYQASPYRMTMPAYQVNSTRLQTPEQRQANEFAASTLLPLAMPVATYGASQLAQNGLMRAGTGATAGEVLSPAIGMLAASRLSPFGQNIGRYAGKILDWLW